MTFRQIEQLAMELSAAEREALASRLIASIDTPALNAVEQAWVDEAERRLDEILEGKVEAIPGDQFFDLVKRDLGWN